LDIHLHNELPDERQLFAEVADGNTASFRRLLDRYQENIFGLALAYLKSFDKAQDIVQEVFLVVWERRSDFRNLENPQGFLFTIARNKIISEFRKKRPGALDIFEQMHGAATMPVDRRFEDAQIYQLVQSAVEKLPEQQKKVFILAKREGFSYDEIAVKLGISRETVKVHMVKALAYLRSFLRQLNTLFLTLSIIFLFFFRNH
jgi:RNA polymerase sigma-70 factor (ECF subfamily)